MPELETIPEAPHRSSVTDVRRATRVARSSRRKSPMRKSPALAAVQYGWAIVLAVFTLFPFYWMLVSALRGSDDVLTSRLMPGPFTLEGFVNLMDVTPFPTYLTNSMIASLSVTALTIVIVTPIAYALSKMRGRLGRALGFSVLLGYMVPEVLLMIPIFVILVRINLDNSLAGLVVGLLSVTMPLGLWLMTGFMKTIPSALEEAARIDGASWLEIFWHVILPLARPGILTVGIFSFIIGWTDYLFALIMIRSEELKTLPVGLSTLYGKFDSSWSEIMAGAVLVSIPAIVLVAATARHFVGGLSQGATKG